MKKLDIIATIKDGIALALVNYLSIVCAVALYVVTIWIPYLNVGTTIAMASIPAEMAKGNVISPFFIFDGKYRRNMGEFFILIALMSGAIWVGFMFGVIPGIVISYAWYLAVILFVDQDKSALEALRESNRITYGNKARIFYIEALLAIILCIAIAIINALFSIGEVEWLQIIGAIIVVIIAIFFVPAMLGAQAVIYKKLAFEEVETEIAEPKSETVLSTVDAPKAADSEAEVSTPAKKRAPRKPSTPQAE